MSNRSNFGSNRSGFRAASEVCGSDVPFGTWAGEVFLCLPPRLSLPPALQELVAESCKFPGWLFNQGSNEYKQFQIISTQDSSTLSLLLAGRRVTSVADGQLSQDVLRALDRILHLCQVHRTLLINSPNFHLHFNESDLRQPLDDLARHVWLSETGPQQGYLFRSECALKLPKTDRIKIADSTVGSAAFFFHPNPEYPIGLLPPAIGSILNSTVHQYSHLYLVHWVIEYKLSAIEEVKRQVLYGMTSGLYQRRALGRLDDFVFGTAHSGSGLVVYAARWEKRPSEAQQPPDISCEGKTTTDAELGGTASPINPPATSKKRSGEPAPGVEHTDTGTKLAGPSGDGFPNKRFKSGSETTPPPVADDGGATNKNSGYKIVVYQLGEYVTVDPADMIQYYLLMRASRKLADGYRADLFTDPWAAVVTRLRVSPVFDWPSPPRPHAKAPSGLRGGHQAQLEDSDSDASLAYEPEDAAEWREAWRYERQVAIEECGPSSLKGFKSAESGIEEFRLEDRVSVYLDSLHN